jgi:putative transposase
VRGTGNAVAATELAFGIGGKCEQAVGQGGYLSWLPQAVRTDNGPDCTCRAFMTWAQKLGIKHILVELGSPTQNAYIESFNGTFRDA